LPIVALGNLGFNAIIGLGLVNLPALLVG